jgi:4-amino-4-deoxy-L-arabinose transferase-like glycosyltransferase
MQRSMGRLPQFTRSRFSADWIIVPALFVGAAVLRVWGVSWSLPYVIHPDESNVVDAGVRIIKSGDLNPHWFLYPTLVIYLQTAVYKLNLLWGTWQGYYTGPASLPDRNHIFALAPELYLWGRTVTALISAAAVAGLYGLGKAMFGRAAGLAAALLLLTAPAHVENAHYLVTDTALGACALLVLAGAWRLAVRPSPRAALLAGALVGLCAGAKYNGAYTALVPALAWILNFRFRILDWRRESVHGVISTSADALTRESQNPKSKIQNLKWLAVGMGMALAALATFLIVNPYTVLDWTPWSRAFLFQITDYRAVEGLAGMAAPFRSYVDMLWNNERLLLLPALAGAALLPATAWRARDARLGRAAWLLIPFPPLFILLMSRFERTFERNLIVILPFLALLGGYAAAWLAGGLARRAPTTAPRPLRSTTVLAGVLGLALAAEPGRQMINFDRYLAGPDSRLTAFAWVTEQARAGRRAAIEMHPLLACAPDPWACPYPDIYAPLEQLPRRPPAWYADRGYDYVVLVGREEAVLEEISRSGPRDPAELAPYLALPVARHFPGDGEGGKGPPVTAYQVAPDGLAAMRGVTRVGTRFGAQAELWGYALRPLTAVSESFDPAALPAPAPDAPYTPGGAVGLRLYWRALAPGTPTTPRWTVAVHLLDAQDAKVSQVDVEPISRDRLRPVRAWYPSEFLDGAYNLPLPAPLPPGAYRLRVILYDPAGGGSLPVHRPGATDVTPYLDLTTINVNP